MRYCIGCGKEIGNDRFCDRCGTDNGEVRRAPSTGNYQRYAVHSGRRNVAGRKPVSLPRIPVSTSVILHWAAMIFLLITAVFLLKETCSAAETVTGTLLWYHRGLFGFLPVAIYFVLGMWSMIPAVTFILSGGRGPARKVTAAAVILLILTVASYVLHFMAYNFSSLPEIIEELAYMMMNYRLNMSSLIFLEIVTMAVSMTATYFARKEEVR